MGQPSIGEIVMSEVKMADAVFLSTSKGNLADIVRLAAINRSELRECEVDYGEALAAMDPDNHLLPELAGIIFGEDARLLGHCLSLQNRGAIPRDIDLPVFVAVANSRGNPPERILLTLMLRGAREKSRGNKRNDPNQVPRERFSE